jgi:ABC-2 type transport system ATP-binding protein
MLKVDNLSKYIAQRPVLSGVNFEIKPGCITGIIGENGAGKTTLLKSICGILRPTQGHVTFNDANVFESPQIRHKIAFVSEEADFFRFSRVQDILLWMQDIYAHFDAEHFHKLNQKFQIPLDTKIQKLSKGMRMKISLMIGLSIRPELLLLDEPTTGLDPSSRKNLFEMLIDEVSDHHTTVLISSHLLNDLEQVCDHIIMIKDGQILNDIALDTLKSSYRQIQVCFNDHIPAGLHDIPGVLRIKTLGRVAYLTVAGNIDQSIKDIESFDILFWEALDMRLEDIFITTNEVGEAHYENAQTSIV